MKLYLMRHGIAVERDEPGVVSDASRALTDEGLRRVRGIGAALASIGVDADEIWTSPLLRARQTAEAVCAALGEVGPVRTVDELEPDGSIERLIARVLKHAELAEIVLVGHQPYLTTLACVLLGAPISTGIAFKKGGVACLEIAEFDAPIRADLAWLLTPKQMLLMG